ncbi:class I SAM-dependent methyltransferase [bacterium]|nr:class I SAM-dependent methyltransferase [bacterium]
MEQNIRQKLLEINDRFYDQFASSFSATRGRVQPGVRQLLPRLLAADHILDVGCGNGTLARALAAADFSGDYLGLDLSGGLLDAARDALGQPETGSYAFQQMDLADPDWTVSLSDTKFNAIKYDAITCFAVLHHLPGAEIRQNTVQTFHHLVEPDGFVVVSVWQWQNSPRLVERVLPWNKVNLSPNDLDEGDVLLDWRAAEQVGLRYVHTYSEESLTQLAEGAGFTVGENFFSDGKPGNLALYQVWQPN